MNETPWSAPAYRTRGQMHDSPGSQAKSQTEGRCSDPIDESISPLSVERIKLIPRGPTGLPEASPHGSKEKIATVARE